MTFPFRRSRPLARRHDAPRILVPFAGSLDQSVLDAAIRIAKAEDAVLVPAYLLVVPLRYAEDSPLRDQVKVAMPLLEAVEHAALRAGVPVDARIEKGRTLTHAVKRLWEAEQFDRIVAAAPAAGREGFTPKGARLAPYECSDRDGRAQARRIGPYGSARGVDRAASQGSLPSSPSARSGDCLSDGRCAPARWRRRSSRSSSLFPSSPPTRCPRSRTQPSRRWSCSSPPPACLPSTTSFRSRSRSHFCSRRSSCRTSRPFAYTKRAGVHTSWRARISGRFRASSEGPRFSRTTCLPSPSPSLPGSSRSRLSSPRSRTTRSGSRLPRSC